MEKEYLYKIITSEAGQSFEKVNAEPIEGIVRKAYSRNHPYLKQIGLTLHLESDDHEYFVPEVNMRINVTEKVRLFPIEAVGKQIGDIVIVGGLLALNFDGLEIFRYDGLSDPKNEYMILPEEEAKRRNDVSHSGQ